MSELEAARNDGTDSSSMHSGAIHFLWQQLPYIVALALAIAGAGPRATPADNESQMEA